MGLNHKCLEEKVLAEQAYINELLQSIPKNYAIAVDTAKQVRNCREQNAPTAELVDEMDRRLLNARVHAQDLFHLLNKYVLFIMDI